MSCFGCDVETVSQKYDDKSRRYDYKFMGIKKEDDIFQVTAQNRRVICGLGPFGYQRCLLRIDRAMQLRRVSYQRALEFIQNRQYLLQEDVDLSYILFYKKKFANSHWHFSVVT